MTHGAGGHEEDASARYVRVCSECGAPVTIRAHRIGRSFMLQERVICPRGCSLIGWHIVDRELRSVVGAAHVVHGGTLYPVPVPL